MFREITENDRDFYINTVKAFYNSDAVLHSIPDDYIVKTFEELMHNDTYAQAFIIEKDDKRAGYALLAKTFSQEAGGIVLWLDELYILPEFRSCGLGSAFLEFLKQIPDTARLRLELCPSNKKACEVYKRQGFENFGYAQMIYEKKEP